MNNPGELDRANVFLLFANFCGDVVKTAAASGLREVDILKMCSEEGWSDKLGPILALKKSTKPGDLDRAISRALNYVQAHRFRLLVERAIQRISGMSGAEFDSYLLSESTNACGLTTKKLTTRALADLASALEKAHAACYQALGDTTQDRARRKESEGDSDVSAIDLHAAISAGLSAVRASSSPRALLLDAQLSEAENIVKAAAKPVNPYDE